MSNDDHAQGLSVQLVWCHRKRWAVKPLLHYVHSIQKK